MTVLSFVTDDRFVIRVVKHLNTNPANQWANSYEFVARSDGPGSDLLLLAEVVVAFEVQLHKISTLFDRVLISTWEADSVPYDPDAFIASPLGDIGAVGITSDVLALNQALSVTRVSPSGRFGHLFYRNCLEEDNVQAPAGVTRLNDRALFQTLIDEAMISSALDGFLSPTGSSSLRMAMINKNGSQVRPVVGLIVQGVTTLPTDHAWFNRSSAP
jgi:hypothetical protein